MASSCGEKSRSGQGAQDHAFLILVSEARKAADPAGLQEAHHRGEVHTLPATGQWGCRALLWKGEREAVLLSFCPRVSASRPGNARVGLGLGLTWLTLCFSASRFVTGKAAPEAFLLACPPEPSPVTSPRRISASQRLQGSAGVTQGLSNSLSVRSGCIEITRRRNADEGDDEVCFELF